MKIYAPVKDFNGVRAGVRFINGVGETDDVFVVRWFEIHGYEVEKCENSHEIHSEKCDEPDFDSMTPNDLRDWAKANGLGNQIKNIRNREKLLEIIRG